MRKLAGKLTNEMKTPHTPTPWKVNRPSSRVAHSIVSNDGKSTVCYGDIYIDDAAFIVRAANCHDELLAALEEVVHGAIPHKRDFLITPYALNLVKAAIKKAEDAK